MASTYYSRNPSKIVIKTYGYGVGEGFACEITLPNGKLYYTGHASLYQTIAEEKKFPTRIVRYYGACIYCNINERALNTHHFPIQIDDTDISTYKDKLATDEEAKSFIDAGVDIKFNFVYKGIC